MTKKKTVKYNNKLTDRRVMSKSEFLSLETDKTSDNVEIVVFVLDLM